MREVKDIGVMLELAPGVSALLHVRNIKHAFVSVSVLSQCTIIIVCNYENA